MTIEEIQAAILARLVENSIIRDEINSHAHNDYQGGRENQLLREEEFLKDLFFQIQDKNEIIKKLYGDLSRDT